MSRVVLDHVSKAYPGQAAAAPAVRGVSLTVEDGEFMVLVGPSGCGKSTLLRLVAGLETPDTGTVSIGHRVVNDVPPKDRDLAMVFQSYALYPHLTVFENLAFGLRLRKLPRAEIDARVRAAAAQLDLAGVLDRLPKALSGGQRQRVAVGRAIVRQPQVFLFDEPLSNLDAQLRAATRAELIRLHRRLHATMLYVTHDQVEAMTMGDRICVLHDGRVQQVAPPLELYQRPANLFVAGFIGSPPMNRLAATLARDGNSIRLTLAAANSTAEDMASQSNHPPVSFALPTALCRLSDLQTLRPSDKKSVILGLRPENLHDACSGPAQNLPVLETRIELVEPMGAETHLHLRAGAATLVARVAPGPAYAPGDTFPAALDLAHAHFFDAATGMALG
jgi:multiple sugar transport system ATP-binding protein